MTCPPDFVNGTTTHVKIDSTPTSSVTWNNLGGETTSKITVNVKTIATTSKDSLADENMPVSYDWQITGEANWDGTDTAQGIIRGAPLGLAHIRVSWCPAGLTNGYWGYATMKWDATAPDRNVQKMTFTADGCGDLNIS